MVQACTILNVIHITMFVAVIGNFVMLIFTALDGTQNTGILFDHADETIGVNKDNQLLTKSKSDV
jgi:hypothetical protein